LATPIDSPEDENTRLRACLDDLVRITADGQPARIGSTLLDALASMLPLSFAFVRLNDLQGGPSLEVARVADPFVDSTCEAEIREALEASLGDAPLKWPQTGRVAIRGVEFSIASARLGLQGELGVVVTGSQRVDFPSGTEELILTVAANQAVTGLLQALLVIEQKRASNELHDRAEQRTGELSTAEEEFKQHDGEWLQMLDSIPGPVALATATGELAVVNRLAFEYFGRPLEELRHWGKNDIVHPEDLHHAVKLFARSVELGTPYETEERLRRSDGVYRWFQVRGFPLRDSTGQVVRWCVLLTDIDDRKRAEESVRASERNLKLIIDTIPSIAWSARTDGSADFFNQHYLDYVGLLFEEVKDWGWKGAVHPDDLNGLNALWQRVMASGQGGEAEARLRRFDGSYRWFLFRASPLRDESGNIIKWYGTNIDIEDRKRGEESLRIKELSWRQIVDNIPGFVHTTSATGQVEFLNQQVLEYFGKAREELKDWSRNDLVHPDDLPRVIETWRKSIETGQGYEVEQRCRRADGVYRWFQARGRAVRNSEGEITAWYWLLTDIEDRKRAEVAARASERNLKLILDTIPAIAWSAHTDGSADFFSQDYLDYVGLAAEAAKDWGWTAAVHPDDLKGLAAEWQRIMASGQSGEAEARLRRFDGSYRWFLFRASPLRDESGKIVKWYGTNIDIEDRKRGEEALRARETSWRQIVDNIPGLVATTGAMGEVEFLNLQTLEYFGRTSEELKDWALIDAVHPGDLPQVIETRKKSIETGQIYNVEHRCRRADGVYRWFQVRGLPVRNAEGTITDWYLLLTDIDDRKQAEEALRARERELSVMINAIPAVIALMRDDGSPLYGNQLVTDYTGLTLEDMLKEDFRARLFHPEDFARLREARQLAFTRAVPFENEIRALGKDGKYRWFLFRYKPLVDESGRIERWYMAAFDIEDRKRAEAQVEQAYLRLAEAQHLSKTGSFITDLLVDDHNWSDEAFRIFEFDPETRVTVQMIRDRVHPEDLPLFDSVIGRGMAGEDVDFVFRIVTVRGAVKHIRGLARVIEQVAGRPLFIGALQDVTESKIAEDSLRASERNLNLIVNTIPALAWSARPDGFADFFNQHYLEYVGLSAEQSMDWGWTSAVHPDDLDDLVATLRGIIAAGHAGEAEARLRRNGGEYRWVLFRMSPLSDENGNILKWYGINTDIDDRRRAERLRLEERVNERTRIARELHDTLLQSFQGLLMNFWSVKYLIGDRPREAEEELDRLVELARQAITEGRDAVQGLRSSTGIANDLVRAITTFGHGLASESSSPEFCLGVQGTCRDLSLAVGDEVYRIASEALRNAFRYAGARKIEVEIHYDSREFRVQVRDDGKGIDPKTLEAGGRAGHHGMTGMRERAKLAGGSLTVSSALDSGTRIMLTIPAALAYARASSAAQTGASGQNS
jgi:PAS domain S-box-containing protein